MCHLFFFQYKVTFVIQIILIVFNSVGDLDPDPLAFVPPRSESFPFSHKGVERTEIMRAK